MGLIEGMGNAGATPEQSGARRRQTEELLRHNPELAQRLSLQQDKLGGFTLQVVNKEGLDG